MIDVSDGIAGDLYHICRMSQVGAEIQWERIPTPRLLGQVAAECQQSEEGLSLHSGEDYELLFTCRPDIPEEEIKALGREVGIPISWIGQIVSQSEGYQIIEKKGQRKPLQPGGWDHFKI